MLLHVVHTAARPAPPDQLVRTRIDDVQDQRPGVVVDTLRSTIVGDTIPVKSIDSIGIDASADVGVIVNQKVGRRRRRQHEPAGGQATLDGALNVITKEGITIALRIVAWQRIRRSPGKRRLNALPCAGSGLAKASAPAEAPFVLMMSPRSLQGQNACRQEWA